VRVIKLREGLPALAVAIHNLEGQRPIYKHEFFLPTPLGRMVP
jgi:hypothetical protein